jgi:hypothetical protein
MIYGDTMIPCGKLASVYSDWFNPMVLILVQTQSLLRLGMPPMNISVWGRVLGRAVVHLE